MFAAVIRNIIFDWCGTLVDDLEAVWKATNKTFERSKVPPITLEDFRREFELPFSRFYDRYTPHVSTNQLNDWYQQAFQHELDHIKPLAHARDFLEKCRANGLTLFVLSSIDRKHFQRHLEITQFKTYFRKFYLGVRDKRERIGEVLEKHELKPEETLFIGDMQHDIDAAKRGGVHSCGVLTGFNTHEQLAARNPDVIVEHLGELWPLLQSDNGKWPGAPVVTGAQYPIPTVGALIYDVSGRMLMIQTHKWSNKWGIPGGKIRAGERVEDGLKREIEEETNLTVDDLRFVMVQDAIDPPEFYKPAHFLLLNYTCLAVPPLNTRLNHEAHSYRWVSPEEAAGLDLNRPTRKLLEAVNRKKRNPADALPRPTRDPERFARHQADRIILEDIEVQFRIGVPDEERNRPQRLSITVVIEGSLQAAARSDALDQTIDYEVVAREITAFGDNRQWRLLERLTNDLALWILHRFGGVTVTVEIKKFVLANTRYVAARMTRSCSDLVSGESN